MASPVQTSFSCTKDAQDKHNVPPAQKKRFSLSEKLTKYPNRATELTLGNLEIKQKIGECNVRKKVLNLILNLLPQNYYKTSFG